MIPKVGNTYRNRESNIPCFISDIKNNNYVLTWCFKSKQGVNHYGRPIQAWEEIIEGPDGYKEYNVIKEHKDLLYEVDHRYLEIIDYKEANKVILNWIPQHCFLTILNR